MPSLLIPRRRSASALAAALGLALALPGCDGGDAVDQGAPRTSTAPGPRIVWDLGRQPLPEIPLPNDVATYPDPTSPTGLRVNASAIATTLFERTLRRQFDEMDGWGTFMPISVAFEGDLDLREIERRHQHDGGVGADGSPVHNNYDFRDDVVYVVDLTTGLPVPLDMGNGNFPLTLRNPQGDYPNDPRAGGTNYLLATVDEDLNHDGILQPLEDGNFDGVMQRAAVSRPGARPEDALTTYWEPETHSLIIRPMLPLRERTRYAVVVTDRLRGTDGPVRSPFDQIAHPSQLAALAPLRTYLADGELSRRFYGGLRWDGASGDASGSRVVFAWTFTTETTVSDMFDVYDGLHGRGPFAQLAQTQPDFRPHLARGGNGCPAGQTITNPYIVPASELRRIAESFLPTLGFSGPQADALLASLAWVDYVAIATIQTPFLSGDPLSLDQNAHWDINSRTGHIGHLGRDEVQVWIYVPKRQPGVEPPFPVAINAHGYSVGAIQSIAFGGYFARFGIATLAANAPLHGFPFGPGQATALRALLAGNCLGPFGPAVVAGRSRDLNGDGVNDSGADFLTAHVFRTRDMLRQTALDYMQLARAMSDASWSQPGSTDYNSDGRMDAPGDLNGDGVVDFGGTRNGQPTPVYMWGESLGGITSMILGALDPAFTAVAPVSGGAGLTDVALRSTVTGVSGAVLTPTLGPMIIAVPARERPPAQTSSGPRTRTACTASEMSLRWVVQDAADIRELEFACEPAGAFAPGDDVMVYNAINDTTRCARVPADGRLFVPIPADLGDSITVTVLNGHGITDYGTCARATDSIVRTQIRTFEVGEGDCAETCGHIPPVAQVTDSITHYNRHATLVAPAAGLGFRRQTSSVRRFIQLAQAAIDPGDPVNFAPLFFLRPHTANAHPILSMTTVGDTDVPIASGNTFARAAGLLPFLRDATGTALDEFVTPQERLAVYHATPDDVLVQNYVIEGLSRLERFPNGANPRYLFDADDLDEGRQMLGEVTLSPPLRLVRAARPVRTNSGTLVEPSTAASEVSAVWQPRGGEALASFINAYVRPEGVHTFYPSDPSEAWDNGNYLGNLIARFFQTNGADVEYYTNPTGHQCLEDSSCAFIPRTPPP